jgi:hypothetical protein
MRAAFDKSSQFVCSKGCTASDNGRCHSPQWAMVIHDFNKLRSSRTPAGNHQEICRDERASGNNGSGQEESRDQSHFSEQMI